MILSRDDLRDLYVERGMTCKEIAERVGACTQTILNWLNKHNIPRRAHSSWHKVPPKLTKAEISNLYVKRGLTCRVIGNQIGVNHQTIRSWLKKYDIPRRRRGNKNSKKHGSCDTPTYGSWRSMLKRGRGQKPEYVGVRVCARWEPRLGGSFENFVCDMGERPPGTTIGRFGDTGHYELGNCAWMTPKEQAANFRADRPTGGRKCEPGCSCGRHRLR